VLATEWHHRAAPATESKRKGWLANGEVEKDSVEEHVVLDFVGSGGSV